MDTPAKLIALRPITHMLPGFFPPRLQAFAAGTVFAAGEIFSADDIKHMLRQKSVAPLGSSAADAYLAVVEAPAGETTHADD